MILYRVEYLHFLPKIVEIKTRVRNVEKFFFLQLDPPSFQRPLNLVQLFSPFYSTLKIQEIVIFDRLTLNVPISI